MKISDKIFKIKKKEEKVIKRIFFKLLKFERNTAVHYIPLRLTDTKKNNFFPPEKNRTSQNDRYRHTKISLGDMSQ